MRRLLITGGTGLLGLNWACAVRERCSVVLATHRHRCALAGVTSAQVVLDDPDSLSQVFAEVKPDLVIHAAGLTNVDDCEANPAAAENTNVLLAKCVATACRRTGTQLVHISTDHLFAGDSPNSTEEAIPSPLNAYARTKLAAERAVAEECADALIVRTNFFGWGSRYRKSLSDWVIENLRANRPIHAFTDVFITPILIDRLAAITHLLAEQQVSGIVNVVGNDRVSKYQFATDLARTFKLPLDLVEPASVCDLSLKAPRPRDMSLSNAKLRSLIGTTVGPLGDQMRELLDQEAAGRHRELVEVLGVS